MGTGIRVQVLMPGLTVTEFHSRLGADFTAEQRRWMRPHELVDMSLRALEKGKVVYIPGVKRRPLVTIAGALPRRVYYRTMHAIGQKVKSRWDEMEMASNVATRDGSGLG